MTLSSDTYMYTCVAEVIIILYNPVYMWDCYMTLSSDTYMYTCVAEVIIILYNPVYMWDSCGVYVYVT